MREILFRAKRIDNGEWVEGYFGTKGETAYKEKTYFIMQSTLSNNCETTYFTDYEVIPETVGQYTGLTDKNGNKIFEGDIVKCSDEQYGYSFVAVVVFGNPNGEYNWGFQLKRIRGAGANTDILLWVEMEETGAYIEIIGNIHDNPELLKGGAENG